MSERDSPAVRVRALVVYSEFAHHSYGLTGKRLVEFDQIDLVQREAGQLQRFRHRHDWSHSHDLRRHAADGVRDETRERLEPELLRALTRHHDDPGGAVRCLTGITRGDCASGMK